MTEPLEVWTRCESCGMPVRLLGSVWHHEYEAAHPALPDMGREPLVGAVVPGQQEAR